MTITQYELSSYSSLSPDQVAARSCPCHRIVNELVESVSQVNSSSRAELNSSCQALRTALSIDWEGQAAQAFRSSLNRLSQQARAIDDSIYDTGRLAQELRA